MILALRVFRTPDHVVWFNHPEPFQHPRFTESRSVSEVNSRVLRVSFLSPVCLTPPDVQHQALTAE